MDKVVLCFKSTDPQNSGFESGFNVSQQIFKNKEHPTRLTQGTLPSCPRIPHLHSLWLEQYNSLNHQVGSARIDWADPMPSNIAQSDIEGCENSMRELENEMQQWLDNKDSDWWRIREHLRGELGNSSSNSEICILIQADETLIWQLPWLFWDLLSQSSTRRRVSITFGHL